MTPLDVGLAGVIVLGVGGVAVHHRFWRARKARIRTEAEAFGRPLGDEGLRLSVGARNGDGMNAGEPPDGDAIDDLPTLSCARCGREWTLDYELDELRAGNRAVEQFALDHERHTGHFPDDVTPWLVDCRQCPDRDGYLAERPARRWAETHARHTGHAVELHPPTDAGAGDLIGEG